MYSTPLFGLVLIFYYLLGENACINQCFPKYQDFVSQDIPDKLHDNVVGAIDVSQYKNMRDLNKKIKDAFVAYVKF